MYKLSPRHQSRRNNFCLVRLLPYAKKDLLVASDLACNIHLFRITSENDCLSRPFHVIFNAHAKLISDLTFMTVPVPQCSTGTPVENTPLDYQHYVASCAYDGYLKIWSVQSGTSHGVADAYRPLYELFSSKKWLYGLSFDVSNLCLYSNGEGKHFPQKIIYIQHNRVVPRKYNFFSENVLQTQPGVEHVYSCGINGIVYRLSKQDISRHLVKQKEKLKNKQVTKLFGFKSTADQQVEVNFQPTEDGNEDYLYVENECAISCLAVLPIYNDATSTDANTTTILAEAEVKPSV